MSKSEKLSSGFGCWLVFLCLRRGWTEDSGGGGRRVATNKRSKVSRCREESRMEQGCGSLQKWKLLHYWYRLSFCGQRKRNYDAFLQWTAHNSFCCLWCSNLTIDLWRLLPLDDAMKFFFYCCGKAMEICRGYLIQ